MSVPLAGIADHVSLTAEGKINVMGEFDTIFAGTEPAHWYTMYFVAKVKISAAADDVINFTLTLEDEDEQLVAEYLNIQGPRPEPVLPGVPAAVPLVVHIAGATFPKLGTYFFRLYGNGTLLQSIPVYVIPPAGG